MIHGSIYLIWIIIIIIRKYLKKGRRESNEESGSSPEESTVGNDVGPVMAGREIGSEREAGGLNYGSEKG
ncbi:hypothetical protein HanIR_Chr05g0229251 [Helianthus annuus]|nr:hypothetical protein HanIR_Chr05g0229251 [Helianthus annuus]